jgi:hypothetical protein
MFALSTDPTNLGKLISKHPTAPSFIQRAAIVALLSFLFFLAMLITFFARQQVGYLILAAAFLVINIFTMIGFMMQRRNVVRVFENGMSYGNERIDWKSVKSIRSDDKDGLIIEAADGANLKIPNSIADFKSLASYIRTKAGQ